MHAYLNTLGTVSRRGQWRFRQVLRARRADGRLDTTDAGLVDFTSVTAALLTASPRMPVIRAGYCTVPYGPDARGEPAPVLAASLADGSLRLYGPGIVEALFPAGSLLAFPRGIYDVRILLTIGPETSEVFDEAVSFE